jgi:hypothetical protein
MDAVNLGSPGARLRALLNRPGIVISPGVFDGFSLRLVDVGIMGYAENLRSSSALAAIPLSADGDTG